MKQKKLPGFCAAGLVVSRKKIQFLVVDLHTASCDPGGGQKFPAKSLSFFTTLRCLPRIFVSSGLTGLLDVLVTEAIYEAVRQGRPVAIRAPEEIEVRPA